MHLSQKHVLSSSIDRHRNRERSLYVRANFDERLALRNCDGGDRADHIGICTYDDGYSSSTGKLPQTRAHAFVGPSHKYVSAGQA